MNPFIILKNHKKILTKQQYRTIKGQMIAGDVEGALKGLKKIKTKKRGNKNE